MAIHRWHRKRKQNKGSRNWWHDRPRTYAAIFAGYDERRQGSSVDKRRVIKWVHDTFARYRKFEWQEGYGAFSVSASQLDKTFAYISRQKEHHRKKTFEEEFRQFLDKHGVEYDPRYVFR